jgi:hypothetical protein
MRAAVPGEPPPVAFDEEPRTKLLIYLRNCDFCVSAYIFVFLSAAVAEGGGSLVLPAAPDGRERCSEHGLEGGAAYPILAIKTKATLTRPPAKRKTSPTA